MRTYGRAQRREQHAFVEEAVSRAGGKIIWSSGPAHAPLFLSVEDAEGHRQGLLLYIFRASPIATRNRPPEEYKLQIRYGSEKSWETETHWVGFDPAGVDLTLMLGVAPDADLVVGLDPVLYDPLPMGISVFWREQDAKEVHARG